LRGAIGGPAIMSVDQHINRFSFLFHYPQSSDPGALQLVEYLLDNPRNDDEYGIRVWFFDATCLEHRSVKSRDDGPFLANALRYKVHSGIRVAAFLA
jgi:hypothetical protein